MKIRRASELAYYAFESLDNNIVHAISTRLGGVSPAPFDTLNLSVSTGDAVANVTTNVRHLQGVGARRIRDGNRKPSPI